MRRRMEETGDWVMAHGDKDTLNGGTLRLSHSTERQIYMGWKNGVCSSQSQAVTNTWQSSG